MFYERIPYFYVIRHKKSGKLYMGCKYSKDFCHPDLLLSDSRDGYKTSSNAVKAIINEEGIDSFEIIEIITDFQGMTILEYETSRLQEVDARRNNLYFNKTNNDGSLGKNIEDFKQIMLKTYGVEHYSQHPDYKVKIKKTFNERYGKDFYYNQEQARKTSLERYGSEYYTQTQEYKEKVKLTSLEKYGVEHFAQSDEVKENRRKGCMRKYGVDNYSQTIEGREISRRAMKAQRDKEEPITCEFCLKTVNVGNFHRWHGNNCNVLKFHFEYDNKLFSTLTEIMERYNISKYLANKRSKKIFIF